MNTMSGLCIVLLCTLSSFSVFGQDTCPCKIIGNKCDFTNKYNHPTKQNRENVALAKPAVSSSTYRENEWGYGKFLNQQGCLANNGNRGRYTNFYWENPAYANCIHTSDYDPTPKWTVNLQRNYTILEIAVYPRVKYEYRMVTVEIRVDDRLCYRFTSVPGEVLYTRCQETLTGQYVSVSKHTTKDRMSEYGDHTLNICEVEVWSCRDGYYGNECSKRCPNCKNGCDYYNGTCFADYAEADGLPD